METKLTPKEEAGSALLVVVFILVPIFVLAFAFG
jgi:hypothetical protein